MHSWKDFKTGFAKIENVFDCNWQNRNWIPILLSSCYFIEYFKILSSLSNLEMVAI